MRVTLVTRHAELVFMPLALLYLKAALVDHARMPADDVTILEFDPAATVSELAAAIDASAPDVLGLSCYVWNVIDLMAAAAAVKARRPDLRVVAGGPEVGPIAERVMQTHSCVDVIVKSEGEGPLVELVNRWRTGNDLHDVLGIWERQEGRVVEHPDVTRVAELDELSSPHLRGYVSHHRRIVCVETQRGCVFRCSFCFYNKDFSIRNRRFDLDRVKEEIGFWLEQDIEQLYLMDPVFNLNKARAKEICHFLIERNRQRIPLHAEVWAEFIDDELAALMKAANFTYLEVGLQSTNLTALAAVDRRLRMQPFLDGVEHLRAHKVPFELQLIIGLPDDTMQTVRESINFVAALRPDDFGAHPLMVLPGTELWRDAGALGLDFHPDPPYFLRSTPTMSAAEVARGRLMGPAVRMLWQVRTIRLLSRESGQSFADVVDAWLDWRAGKGAAHAALSMEAQVAAFIAAHCAAHQIPSAFYLTAAGLELGASS